MKKINLFVSVVVFGLIEYLDFENPLVLNLVLFPVGLAPAVLLNELLFEDLCGFFSITIEFLFTVLASSIFLIDFFVFTESVNFVFFFSIFHYSIFINFISC